jgi:hypothetical protein
MFLKRAFSTSQSCLQLNRVFMKKPENSTFIKLNADTFKAKAPVQLPKNAADQVIAKGDC